MIQNLIQHKGYANACLLRAVQQQQEAAQDMELLKLLHHIILANRFWLTTCLNLPFVIEEESRIPSSLKEIISQYRDTHIQEWNWISQIPETELARRLASPLIPGNSCSVAEALMQVCMHSHGHRAQAATRLRSSGGTPPALDFILWLKEPSQPDWSFA